MQLNFIYLLAMSKLQPINILSKGYNFHNCQETSLSENTQCRQKIQEAVYRNLEYRESIIKKLFYMKIKLMLLGLRIRRCNSFGFIFQLMTGFYIGLQNNGRVKSVELEICGIPEEIICFLFLSCQRKAFLSVLQIMRKVRICTDMGKEAIRSRIQ